MTAILKECALRLLSFQQRPISVWLKSHWRIPRQHPTLLRLILASTSVVLAIAVGEAFCRSFLPTPRSIRFEQDVEELNGLELRQLASVFENDSELFWRIGGNKRLPGSGPFFGVIFNDAGFREDHSIPVMSAGGELRVLCLGDSCTFGYGLDHAQSFVQICEDHLAEELNEPVECINAGVPGYTLLQGRQLFTTRGQQYDPDVVVLCFGWNDMVSWDSRSDYEHLELSRLAQANSVLQWSRLCQLA